MRHLDDPTIERYLARELSEPEDAAVRDHLAGCASCDRRAAAARADDEKIGGLLRLVDHPVPQVEVEDLIRRAARRLRYPQLVAAGIALLIIGGAAAAMPGSPIRAWLGRLAGEPPVPQAARQVTPSGVSLIPDAEFELTFEARQEAGVIRMTLGDDPDLSISATGGSPGFSVEPGRVRVKNSGSSADYLITLPRAAAELRIRVADSVILTVRNGVVDTAFARDVEGTYVVEFAALR